MRIVVVFIGSLQFALLILLPCHSSVSGFDILLFTSGSVKKSPTGLYPIELSKNESPPPSPPLFQSHGPDIDA
jgi:hypothetical protein